jgi:hypothetical protein
MFELRRALLTAALTGVVLCFGSLSTAQAITCTGNKNAPDSCTGADPLTVYPKNTPKDSLNGSPFLGKLDGDSLNVEEGAYAPYFSLSGLDLNGKGEIIGGDWSFDRPGALADSFLLVPTMLAVKAGPNWFFISIVAGVYNGSWDTSLLGNKGTSHLSWYDGARPPEVDPPAVPLPGAVWLFGSALAGLGLLGMRRRRRNTMA